MKKSTLGFVALGLLACSVNAFADKLIVTGNPVVLQKQGTVYYYPSDAAVPTTNQYYVSVNGTSSVCFVSKQPTLTSLTSNSLRVNIGGSTRTLYCYTPDPNYFTIQ